MKANICQVEYVILLLKLILTDLTSQMHHGKNIVGCIWQPFWILQEKVGIFLYF